MKLINLAKLAPALLLFTAGQALGRNEIQLLSAVGNTGSEPQAAATAPQSAANAGSRTATGALKKAAPADAELAAAADEAVTNGSRKPETLAVADHVAVVDPYPMVPGYGHNNYAHYVDWNVDFGLHFNITAGVAYDSNTQLADDRVYGAEWGGLPHVGEWVNWWNVGVSFNGGSGMDGDALGTYYGVDLDGSIFAYSSAEGEAGRDNVEPMIRAYIGQRGGKTDVRFDTFYRMQNGNTVDFLDIDREARRAESNDWSFSLSAERTLDHGQVTGRVAVDRTDFAGTTDLNDVDHLYWDLAWFHDPIWADKTSFGVGVTGGTFDADRNVSQSYWEPSLRAMYEYSPKTDLYAQVGYSFRNFEGPEAINDAGSTTFRLGMNWEVTDVTTAQLEAYRTFHPSFVTAFEDFNVSGVLLGVNRVLPRDFLLRVDTAYENADYFSTIEEASSTREDDYWRVGTTLSHPINLIQRFPGTVSVFYYWNENESSTGRFGFDQYFTGLRVDVGTQAGLGRSLRRLGNALSK